MGKKEGGKARKVVVLHDTQLGDKNDHGHLVIL